MGQRFALFAVLIGLALGVSVGAKPAPAAAPDLFKTLPTGDAVITVDVPAVIGKAAPALLANRPEAKAKLDGNVARLRSDFGLDLVLVRQAAISASLFGGAVEWVAALDGDFGALAPSGALAAKLDAFVKRTPRYTVRAETHEGVALFVLPEKTDSGDTIERTAVAVLDGSTALYGSPSAVRKAVDARKGKAPTAAANTALVEAYGQSDPTRPIRLGLLLDTVVKAQLAADPTDPFVKMLAPIRFVFGTAGVSNAGGVALKLIARTAQPTDAKPLQATLAQLVELGKSQAGDRPDLAALLELVTVTTADADVIVAADVPPDRLDGLFRLVG